MNLNKTLIAFAIAALLTACGPYPQAGTIAVNGDGNTSVVVEQKPTPKVREYVAPTQNVTFTHVTDPSGHRLTIMQYDNWLYCVADTQYTGHSHQWNCLRN